MTSSNRYTQISILAPTQRATRPGSRRDCLTDISILAPTQRATCAFPPSPSPSFYFNPRPHTKGDALKHRYNDIDSKFQSSPPHKGRLRPATSPLVNCFISILAPTQRATSSQGIYNSGRWEFQSSPPHKGRLLHLQQFSQSLFISILAPTQRATLVGSIGDALIGISILAPTQRATAKITINSHF